MSCQRRLGSTFTNLGRRDTAMEDEPQPKRSRSTQTASTPDPHENIALRDIVPHRARVYNVRGRVNFVAMLDMTHSGEYKMDLEILDASVSTPITLTVEGRVNVNAVRFLNLQPNDIIQIRNVRCGPWADNVCLFVLDGDRKFYIQKLHDRIPGCRDLPKAIIDKVQSFTQLQASENPQVAMMVRVNAVHEDTLDVIDHTGATGTIHLSLHVQAHPFMATLALYLGRVQIQDKRVCLCSSSSIKASQILE